jgi:HD-like signal output (HDOD) protein
MTAHSALDELVAEIAELRPLPAAAVRVLQIAEGERFSAHELAQAIGADQALTAKLLHLANSAYYGFARQITTVRDAVVLLGFRAVRTAALTSSVIDAMAGSNHLDHEQTWRFSVTIGMLAEVLARAHGRHQDEAFTAGVLHNIGRLGLDQHRPAALQTARRVAAERDISIWEAERSLFGFSDAELGGGMALHWNFPEELVEAVVLQDTAGPRQPDPDSLAAFVRRARAFAHTRGITDGVDPPRDEPPPGEWLIPPVSGSLNRVGGIGGIEERVRAFVDAALGTT